MNYDYGLTTWIDMFGALADLETSESWEQFAVSGLLEEVVPDLIAIHFYQKHILEYWVEHKLYPSIEVDKFDLKEHMPHVSSYNFNKFYWTALRYLEGNGFIEFNEFNNKFSLTMKAVQQFVDAYDFMPKNKQQQIEDWFRHIFFTYNE